MFLCTCSQPAARKTFVKLHSWAKTLQWSFTTLRIKWKLYQEQKALYNMALSCHSPLRSHKFCSNRTSLLAFLQTCQAPASLRTFPLLFPLSRTLYPQSPHDLFLYIIQASLTICKSNFFPHIISHPHALIFPPVVFVIIRNHLVCLFSPYFFVFF